METFLAIASRREVRDYERRPLPPEVEQRILDAGRLVGNASNRQPWLLRLARCLAKLVVVPNDERSDMTTSQLKDEQRDYYRLCDEARALGIPTSLDDPRSPQTVMGLRLAVELVRDAGHSVEGALNAARAYEAQR